MWPAKGKSICIVDIGAGDGRLISAAASLSPATVEEILLIEPNEEFLKQAVRNCEGNARRITPILSTFKESSDKCLAKADVVVAAHVVYLLPDGELDNLLSRLPSGVPLYLVLDRESSIFSRLWEVTAKKYFDRASCARRLIEDLPKKEWSIGCTTITSEIGNPDDYNETVAASLYSLLAYTDVNDLSTQDFEIVRGIVKRHIVAGKIRCQSNCYELVKLDTGP